MPAITVGFPEFESRLDQIRRRINRLALADAACTIGAALLIAASAIVFAAFAFPPHVFAWALRAGLLAAAIVVAAASWWLHTHWLDLYETALHIDRQAGLDARIATMLAHPTAESRSPLRSVLLWQIFDLAPQWDIERVAPLRVSRPTIAFLAALAIFTLVSLLTPESEQEPPPELPDTSATSLSASGLTLDGKPDPKGAVSAQVQNAPHDAAGDSPADAAGGDRGQREAQGSRPDGAGIDRDRRDPSAKQAARPYRGEAPLDPPQPQHPSDLKPAPPPQAGMKPPKAEQRADAPQPADPNAADKPPRRDNAEKRLRPKGKGGSKAVGSNPRKGKLGGTRGLLAEKGAKPLPNDGDAKPMVIQLKAFAMRPVDQLEPQGKPSGDDNAAEGDATDQVEEIAAQQAEDIPHRRTTVSRAHQELIRDLFTPEPRDRQSTLR